MTSASGCQSSHTYFFLDGADANPMGWDLLLGAKSTYKFSFNALDPGHFPELCYLSSFMAETHPFSSAVSTLYTAEAKSLLS